MCTMTDCPHDDLSFKEIMKTLDPGNKYGIKMIHLESIFFCEEKGKESIVSHVFQDPTLSAVNFSYLVGSVAQWVGRQMGAIANYVAISQENLKDIDNESERTEVGR